MIKKKQTLVRGYYDENYNVIKWVPINAKDTQYYNEFTNVSNKLAQSAEKR